MEETIIRPCFGRVGKIGCFYNLCTEQLFTDQNIFENSLPKDLLVTENAINFDTPLSFETTASKKLSLLKLENDAKLSALCGLFSSNTLDFIQSNENNGSNNICYYIQNIQTSYQYIDMTNPEIQMLSKTKSDIEKSNHIVVGISYGTQTVVKLTFNCNQEFDEEKLHKKISKSFMRLLRCCSVEEDGEDESEAIKKAFSDLSNLKFMLQSNLPMDNTEPQSKEEFLQIMKNIISQSEKNETEHQLYFHLQPFADFQENQTHEGSLIFIPVKTSIIEKKIEPVFDGIDNTTLQLLNLKNSFEKYRNYVTHEERDKLKESINFFKTEVVNFKANLATEVIKYRSEKDYDETDLILPCRGFTKTNEKFKKNILNEYGKVKERIDFMDKISKLGIRIVQNMEEFKDLKNDEESKEIYLFSFAFSKCDDQKSELSENFTYFCSLYNDRKNQITQNKPRNSLRHNPNQIFIVAEGDICPDIFLGENLSTQPQICKIINGKYVDQNLLQNKKILDSQCIVKCENIIFATNAHNYKRQIVQLRCPNTLKTGKCSNKAHIWYCSICCGPLEYGFDEKFYCMCGFQNINNYEFRCNEEAHGTSFLKFDERELKMELSNINEREEINILVLGESGVGKSTWINSTATYLTFDTFDEAKAPGSSLITLIPTKFSFEEPANGKDLKIPVSTGASINECFESGQSATRTCRAYHIPYNDKLIRIIDTPGILDTAGMDQDKKNLENTLTFLNKYNEIHAICILCKANCARLTPNFEYCLNELFTQFHISAAKNFIFCFTKVAESGYQAGETREYINKLLAEIKAKRSNQEINVECQSKERAYMFDNMGYRYLCALHDNHTLKIDQEAKYVESYRRARDETLRLFQQVKSLRPHNTVDSISIFRARNITFQLTKPLIKIGQKQKESLIIRERRYREIKAAAGDLEKLRKILALKAPILHWCIIEETLDVCFRCSEIKEYWGDEREEFLICNPDVYNTNPFKLRQCHRLMKNADDSYYCKNCGPDYTYHRAYRYYAKKESENNMEITKNAIANKQKTKEDIEKQIKQEKQEYSEIEEEIKVVINSTANFYYFLKTQSLVPHNDAAEKYLDILIHNEENRGNNSDKLQALTELKEMLKKEKERLNEVSRCAGEEIHQVSAQDVENLVTKLQNLKHYGPDIKDALEKNFEKKDNITEEPYISYLNQYLHNKNKIKGIIEELGKH